MRKNVTFLTIGLSILFFVGLVYLIVDVSKSRELFSNKNETTEIPAVDVSLISDEQDIILTTIIDASGIYDDGQVKEIADSLCDDTHECTYIKCSIEDIQTIYSDESNKNLNELIIIAPNDVLDGLNIEYETINPDEINVEYNNIAKGISSDEYVPFALVMYGYFIRYDLAQELEVNMPEQYGLLGEFAKEMRDEAGRYGFAISSTGTFEQMMEKQMTYLYMDEGLSAISILYDMWIEQLLPPNTAHIVDDNCVKAYLNDAIAGFYGDGYSLNRIYNENRNLYDKTYVMQYIGEQSVFAVRGVSIAVVKDSETEMVYELIDSLNERAIDVFENNPGILPAFKLQEYSSPYKNAVSVKNNVVYYEGETESYLDKMIFYTMNPYEILGIEEE